MTMTRSLCCSLLLLLSSTVARATTVIVDREVSPSLSVTATSFGADPKTNRAWVVVDFVEQDGEEEPIHSERMAVNGLTYDAATRTIRLDDGGRQVTCAEQKKLLFVNYFRATSACPIRVKGSRETKDDGLDSVAKQHLVIELAP
jgi:hypothetical protein